MKNITIPEQVKDFKLIPLTRGKKTPATVWKDNNDIDLRDFPDSIGYGVDTGKSGLIVIDCDVKNDVDGVENFLHMAEEADNYPSTFSVETPSGGIHFYYYADEGSVIRNSQSSLCPAVDVRANGGYVVGPGSTIFNSDGTEGHYVVENSSAVIEPLPKWLEKKLMVTSVSRAEEPVAEEASVSEGRESSVEEQVERRRALYWTQQKMSSASLGERNSTLNQTAYFLGRKRVPKSEALVLVDLAVSAGLDRVEALKTFESGYEDGVGLPPQQWEEAVTYFNSVLKKDFKSDPTDTAFYTHTALSHTFANAYPERFVYWTVDSCWYQYSEELGVWEKISEESIISLMDDFLDNLVAEIRQKNKYLPPNVYKLQEKLWTKSMVESVVFMTRNRYMISDKVLFNRDKHLLNCKNCIVDLRSGKTLEHNRGFYMTKQVLVDYDPTVKNKNFEKVIESVHPEERDYIQVLAGQSLTGFQPKYQAAIFFHGSGSNGKSTFIDLLLKTSGSYAQLQSPSIFLADKQGKEKYALSDFEDLRCAIVEELPNSKVLDVSALKRLVGTSQINAREIYKSHRTFENQSTIFVSCNKLPMVNETDLGTWRRVLVVSFPYTYKKNKNDLVSENDRLGNPRILHAAQHNDQTAKAFLAWRVAGAIKWYANEKIEYDVPKTIEARTKEWNENNDMLLSWFSDTFEDENESFVMFDDVLQSYNDFLVSRGNKPVSARFFISEFLNHHCYSESKYPYRKRSRVFKDLSRSYYEPQYDFKPKSEKELNNYFIGLKFKR